MLRTARSKPWRTIDSGVKKTFRIGWAMAAFEYRQAQEIRDALAKQGVRYLFIGKSGAILLGFPDTTQDADVFVERSTANGKALVGALPSEVAVVPRVLAEAPKPILKRQGCPRQARIPRKRHHGVKRLGIIGARDSLNSRPPLLKGPSPDS